MQFLQVLGVPRPTFSPRRQEGLHPEWSLSQWGLTSGSLLQANRSCGTASDGVGSGCHAVVAFRLLECFALIMLLVLFSTLSSTSDKV